MGEYIDKEALQRKILTMSRTIHPEVVLYCSVKSIVANAPAADVAEVRHGEWKKRKNWRLYVCSECSHENDEPYRYCPNCGAKMDGKGDTEKSLLYADIDEIIDS